MEPLFEAYKSKLLNKEESAQVRSREHSVALSLMQKVIEIGTHCSTADCGFCSLSILSQRLV